MNGSPLRASSRPRRTVFGHCMKARILSCIRAPPERTPRRRGAPFERALDARMSFSPTTLPMEPPMNEKSKTASSHGCPSIPRPNRSPSRHRARCSAPPLRAVPRTGVDRRTPADPRSADRRPPRRRSRCRRAARCACGPARRSDVRTVRRRTGSRRARRPGSGNRISGTCSGGASPDPAREGLCARSRRQCGWP